VSDCVPPHYYVALVASAAFDLGSDHKTPKHFGEAMRSPDRLHWIQAISEELDPFGPCSVTT
jgi:hypothetical protein